jgi:hypothetical protein
MRLLLILLLSIGHNALIAQRFTVTLVDGSGMTVDSLDVAPDVIKILIQSHDPSSEFQLQKAEIIQLRGTNRVGSAFSYGPDIGLKWWFGNHLPRDRFAINVFVDQVQNGKVLTTSQKSFVCPRVTSLRKDH